MQCIYIDPPYGIRFNSNFQWSTTSRDVKDGNRTHITREPEQVRAFRDTWRDGIHSYLAYLRDRLIVSRELLAENGSIFVQIGEENVHRIRALMDEVFGEENFCRLIAFKKTTGQASTILPSIHDYIVWYAKSRQHLKSRPIYQERPLASIEGTYTWADFGDGEERRVSAQDRRDPELMATGNRFMSASLVSSGASASGSNDFEYQKREYSPASGRIGKPILPE